MPCTTIGKSCDEPGFLCKHGFAHFSFRYRTHLSKYNHQRRLAKRKQPKRSLDYIVMQFPLGRYMAGSVGLLPYSNVGYSFINSIDNGSDSRSGDGNISQAYVGVSGRPFKGFSIGANISYLFGNLTNTNTVVPESGSSGIFETMLKVHDYHLSFGAQYAIEWNKKHTITLGAVYSPGKTLLGRAYTSTYDVSSNTTIDADTLKMKTIIHWPRHTAAVSVTTTTNALP